MEPKTVRRAMRSLAAKGGARLTTAPPMTVYPIRQHSRPSSAARVPSGAAGSELALAQTPRPAPMPARQTGVPSNNLRAAKPGQAKVLREPVNEAQTPPLGAPALGVTGHVARSRLETSATPRPALGAFASAADEYAAKVRAEVESQKEAALKERVRTVIGG